MNYKEEEFSITKSTQENNILIYKDFIYINLHMNKILRVGVAKRDLVTAEFGHN